MLLIGIFIVKCCYCKN